MDEHTYRIQYSIFNIFDTYGKQWISDVGHSDNSYTVGWVFLGMIGLLDGWLIGWCCYLSFIHIFVVAATVAATSLSLASAPKRRKIFISHFHRQWHCGSSNHIDRSSIIIRLIENSYDFNWIGGGNEWNNNFMWCKLLFINTLVWSRVLMMTMLLYCWRLAATSSYSPQSMIIAVLEWVENISKLFISGIKHWTDMAFIDDAFRFPYADFILDYSFAVRHRTLSSYFPEKILLILKMYVIVILAAENDWKHFWQKFQ